MLMLISGNVDILRCRWMMYDEYVCIFIDWFIDIWLDTYRNKCIYAYVDIWICDYIEMSMDDVRWVYLYIDVLMEQRSHAALYKDILIKRCIGILMCSSVYWCIDLVINGWCKDIWMHCYIDILISWYMDVMIYWYIAILLCRRKM